MCDSVRLLFFFSLLQILGSLPEKEEFWGVFIIAVHRAFVLGLGARHRGIVELSEDSCV